MTGDLRAGFVNEVPQRCLRMYQAMCLLGVPGQTVFYRVKRGERDAIHGIVAAPPLRPLAGRFRPTRWA